MWFVCGLGERPYGREVVVLPVVLRFFLGPQLLHRQDGVARLRPAVGKVSPHNFRLLLEPTRSDTKEKPAARITVEGRYLFRQQQRVALGHQTHAGSELDGRGNGRGPRQSHKRVGDDTDGSGNATVGRGWVA